MLWTAAGATDISDKEPFSRRGGLREKERVIVPGPGVGLVDHGFAAPASRNTETFVEVGKQLLAQLASSN